MRIILCSAALFATGIAAAAIPVDGMYTSVFGGYTYVTNNIQNNSFGMLFNSTRYDSGWNAGGRFGYQCHPLRYEAEYTYFRVTADHFDVNDTVQTGVSGFASANLGMANVYLDLPEMLPAIAPFIGGGIGYAYMQTTLEATGPVRATYFNAHGSAFAYQGTVGITYNFAENYAVNLAARYIGSSNTDTFGRRLQAGLASAGVIYHFDQGNYK